MKHLLLSFIFVIFCTGSFLSSPLLSSAQNSTGPDDGFRANQEANRPTGDFIPLVGIPGINTQTSASLPGYINALYTAAISIAAFMAVVKIIFAGVKYMVSDIANTKEDAKKDIRGALIGLLIVLGAVLILNTINPQLKGLTALDGLTPVNVELGGYTGVQSERDRVCEGFGGEANCSVTTCGYFNSPEALGWIGYIPRVTGIDYALNAVGCTAVCSVLRGTIVGESVGNSGDCVYPTDFRVQVEAIREAEEALLEGTVITGEMSEFPETPLTSQTVIDDRRENSALIGLTDEDFLGYVSIGWQTPEGQELLSEYDDDYEVYEYEVLRTVCGSENKIVKVPQPLSRTGYYCVR